MLTTSAMASCKSPSDSKRKQKDGVINNLKDLFGNVLHIDIIRSVASECNFDVQRSSNVLLEMTNNIDQQPKKRDKPKMSSQHASPKRIEPLARTPVVKSKKTLELERVVNNIRQGFRVLVILRGLPGSGKSRLAVAITEVALGPGINSNHILSTDDFFMQRGEYVFDPSRLSEAHEWNQRRAFQAMSKGVSPVIVDNTNTQMWEMKPYAMMGTDYGYIIEILEPDTWWVFNDKELARRNSHNVPRATIKNMLDRYEKNVSTQKLLCSYSLTYKFQKPPQYRVFPPLLATPNYAKPRPVHNGFIEGVPKSKSTSALIEDGCEGINLMDFCEVSNQATTITDNFKACDMNPMDEILMCTEENTMATLQPMRKYSDMENAWGVDEKALQSWDIVAPIDCESSVASVLMKNDQDERKPSTEEASTNVDPGDYLNNSEGFKMIVAHSRDINVHSPVRIVPIPKKIMIDQSCMTDDVVDSGEDRIRDLMDLFPKVPKSALQELFNKCHQNFHWTVDLLLEDNNLEMAETRPEPEKEEDLSVDVCDEEEKKEDTRDVKVFKRKTISEESVELKKCLESKFDINKEHYSEHVYRVKQTKFGNGEPQPSTSAVIEILDDELDSDNDSSDNSEDNPKNMIELNLGETFVEQLETMFGGSDHPFPKGFQPVVQMPVALAQQIYGFYIESVCQQMEAQNHVLDRLVREDEEFARRLQREEIPRDAGRAPPSFVEIMDEQVAMNLHKKGVDEWKNMSADSLAAKLTKQKLFATFPKVDKDALLEIWHAYDYDYNKTVEVLVSSVGPENVNGARETIQEPPLSQGVLQEMKEAEGICGDVQEHEDEKPATYYRDEANKHLKNRSELYEKAKSYHLRGMKEVAMFYSELAAKETRSFDRANHFAAAAFIEEHSKRLQKFDTLDLHYFYVKEAMPNLDIFIDRNIMLLKGGPKKGQDLFVITGRGKNSEGGICKIKPAVMARLKKRKIGFVQLNPGLLKIRVQQDSLMTSDIP